MASRDIIYGASVKLGRFVISGRREDHLRNGQTLSGDSAAASVVPGHLAFRHQHRRQEEVGGAVARTPSPHRDQC